MTPELWMLVVAVGLVLVWATVLCFARVRRLDRLHVRTDAARAGLEAALDRRAAAALSAAEVAEGDGADGLRAAVAAAHSARACAGDREAAENVLGRALGTLDRSVLPPALLAELIDAEQLLILARRVHNDAVRDTLGLRSRRLVRWLHLAGTAPLPAYFEIADPETGVTTTAPPAGPGLPIVALTYDRVSADRRTEG
ncbi:NUDIX hydrolase [Pseudonocardia alaniniphila]|uniref:NUDIX hydrolase n=1 Tax=Pseudonocardia alaniniphila TaxID=75291 RepID=A0ABS9TIP8_9PSEU|nr:NUDIX hydrolase [Pseudonocardia alaniniphila]MCH6168392.1 NUDIX hydrolase [Pseudonocardia alaniniphila]